MKKLIVFWIIMALTGCAPSKDIPDSGTPTPFVSKPMRIISLDLCADQYVLKLIERDRILALSPDAAKDFSYMRESAKGLPIVNSTAEDVLILKPDLIVRSYGGGPNAERFFQSAGVPVITLGWAGNIEGIMTLIRETSIKIGEARKGEAVISDMKRRLAAIKTRARARTALYMTPTGVTTGEGSLIHEMLLAAGLENFQQQSGWRALPLELLAYEKPDLIAAAFFDSQVNDTDAWSSANHPVAQAQMKSLPTVSLQGAWTSCSGWFLMDAIEALAAQDGNEADGNESESHDNDF